MDDIYTREELLDAFDRKGLKTTAEEIYDAIDDFYYEVQRNTLTNKEIDKRLFEIRDKIKELNSDSKEIAEAWV